VFAGYGITAPDLDYDDYATIDAQGKVVIVVRHEPQQADPESRFNGTDDTKHAAFRAKIQNAIEHGAVAILFCTGQHEITKELAAIDKRIDAAQQQLAKGESRARTNLENRVERLQAERKRIEQGMLGFTEAGTSHDGRRVP